MSDEGLRKIGDAKVEPNTGPDLRRFTPARVSLGQTGPAIPTREQLRFQLDHALARDAVHAQLDVAGLLRALKQRGMDGIALRSAVGAGGRGVYLRRPDLGRRLEARSAEELKARMAGAVTQPDLVLVIVDGLSALAVERHAIALLDEIQVGMGAEGAAPVFVAPVCVVSDGRVAVGDEIGFLLQAKIVVVLIGERPGLSSPDSLGVYITWNPKPGRTDAERNCISNVRAEGLSYTEAARKVVYYIKEAKRLSTTGIALKERSGAAELP
jgi:ethanolamine ammonia-lyase small subunit